VKVGTIYIVGFALALLLACVPPSEVKAEHSITGISEVPPYLTQIYHYEAEDAMTPGKGTESSHNATVIEDKAASEGKALRFATTSPAPPGFVVLWGPFQPLPPGDYVALYRMRVPDNDFAIPIVETEVTEESEQQTSPKVIAKAELTGKSFPEIDRFFIFAQPFHLDRDARIELRVLWFTKTDLDVDYRAISRQ